MEKIKVYEVEPGKGLNKCTERHIGDLLDWFYDAQPGNVITIRVKEMNQSDFNSLPEYMGP